jgi:hypothetical protein
VPYAEITGPGATFASTRYAPLCTRTTRLKRELVAFSRVVRVHKGAYRVLAKVAPGPVISAYGTPLLIR